MTMVDLILQYVGTPPTDDLNGMIVFIFACAIFVILMFTPVYLIKVIIQAFTK